MKSGFLFILACSICTTICAQYAATGIVPQYGLSLYDRQREEVKFKRVLEGRSVFGDLLDFIVPGGTTYALGSYKSAVTYKNPFGLKLYLRGNEHKGMGFEATYSEVKIDASFLEENQTERTEAEHHKKLFSFIIFGSYHGFKLRDYPKFNVFFNYGAGIRLGTRRISVDGFSKRMNDEKQLFPIILKFSFGASYFPLKNLGITGEAGLGHSNLSMGIVYRTLH